MINYAVDPQLMRRIHSQLALNQIKRPIIIDGKPTQIK